MNNEVIEPLSVAVGTLKLELDPLQKLNELGAELVDASRIAQNVGSPKSANIVLMGALSQALPFEEDVWREVITKRVPPKTLAANLEAFDLGAQSVRAQ